jgi:hypothetical protein
MEPFVYQLKEALVASGIATPEQGEEFVAYAEKLVREQWEERLDEMRNAPRYRWWERLAARKVDQ